MLTRYLARRRALRYLGASVPTIASPYAIARAEFLRRAFPAKAPRMLSHMRDR